MSLRARIWGCRGSLATPGPATLGIGGNTSCVEVRPEGDALIVLDAGTGIRALGATAVRGPIDLLLTHLHLDHVEGLGFFAPLFDPDAEVTIWGPRPEGASLREWLAIYLSPPFFPLRFEAFPACIEVREVGAESWSVGGIAVRSAWTEHPGPTLAYRLDDGDASLTYIPDNELGRDGAAVADLAAGTDVLLHDAQYTAGEYAARVGWGHSSVPDFARFVRTVEPPRALMFHHDPSHDDAALETMLDEAGALASADVALAREGLEIAVAAPADRD